MSRPSRPLSCPVWLITDSPALRTASCTVHHAVVKMAIAYWQGGCRPLSTDVTTMAAISHVATQHLMRVQSAVLAALAEITPALDADFAKQQSRYARQCDKIAHATAVRLEKQARRKVTPASLQVAITAPRRDSPVRAATVMPSQPVAAAGTGTTFTD